MKNFPALLPDRAELARWGFLAAVGAWLLHPFATGRMIGTGDALWYAQMLADFVTQIHEGHFPVFVGQTEWAWNGAVYPLRVAPFYQHLGGLIDVLTGHQLGWFALQHATVIVSGSLGLASAYLCLRAIDPASPWRACLLACLYLSCPGVLGTIYTQDLYMTWMVLPFPPLALLGTARTFERDDHVAQLLLAAGLAGAWLAHSPIALWLTLIVGATQAVRLLTVHRQGASWRRALLGVAAFLVLGSYPFVSVAMLKIPGATSAVASGLANDQQITQAIRDVFPRVLQPLSEAARSLSDLQLGYGLWLVAAVAGTLCLQQRANRIASARLLPALLLAACAVLLMLLLPVPFITDWLWAHVPGQIKRITFYWPMHRLYLLLAVLLVVALHLTTRARAERSRIAALAVVSIALAWSLWESRQFVRAGRERTASGAISERTLRPENRMLMNHAYGLFTALPDHFTNGVTDPCAELKLRDAQTGVEITNSVSDVSFISTTGRIDDNPGILRIDQEFTLEPGERYALDFVFRARNYTGILQLSGSTFFREYQLPRSGSALAFGSMPGNSPTLNLWTTASRPERVTLRFIPTAPGAKPADFRQFGELRLRKIISANEPIELISLSPLRALIRARADAVLTTPRMALLGYDATVDGAPATTSAAKDGTLEVAVPAGEHRLEVSYRAPWSVRGVYFTTLASWTALLALGCWAVLRRRRSVVQV